MAKAKANLADMPDVRLEIMDLLDPRSMETFAGRSLRDNEKLHILVKQRGYGPSACARCTQVRISILRQPSRTFSARLPTLVCTSRRQGCACRRARSYANRRAGVDFQDPNFERSEYDPWIAYGQSKTANALFAVALDSIGQHQGVRAFSVHPGGIMTDLIRLMSRAEIEASEVID